MNEESTESEEKQMRFAIKYNIGSDLDEFIKRFMQNQVEVKAFKQKKNIIEGDDDAEIIKLFKEE